MAGVAWPFNETGTSGAPAVTARQLRQQQSAFVAMGTTARPLGAKSGIRVGTPSSVVSITGSGPYGWSAGGFGGVIDGEANVAAGPYTYSFETADTGTITASGASARVDRLDVQISDSDEGDGSGAKSVQVVYTQGAATGGQPPAVPARSHRLGYINVPTAGAPTFTFAPEWAGDPGEWTFNTVAERDAYVTLIGSADVPQQQQATILTDPLGANNVVWTWTGSSWRTQPGLVLLKPTSATGGSVNSDGSVSCTSVNSIALDGIFSTAFDNYLVVFDQSTASAALNLNYVERVGGADSTGTYFWNLSFQVGTGAPQGAGAASATTGQITAQTATYRHLELGVAGPALAVRTIVKVDDDSTDTANTARASGTVWHGASLACDGFKIAGLTAETFSAKIRVYGLANG